MTKQLLISQIMDTTQYIFAINMKKEKESFLFLLYLRACITTKQKEKLYNYNELN